jgi:Zn-dependent protease/predicted transcriptional regulator
MESSLTIGRIRGVVVGVHWSVLFVLALVTISLAAGVFPDDVGGYSTAIYWIAALVTGVLFLLSILAHEVSHAVVALRHGVAVDRITLWLLGGVAQLEGGAKTPADEFLIAFVGPLTSIAIGLVGGALALGLDAASAPSLLVEMLKWLAGINLVLAVFNLVPAAPLDGGRVLRAALWAHSKDRLRATVIASKAGRLFGIALIAGGVVFFFGGGNGLWFALLGWFVINAASAEERHAVMERRLGALRVRDVMSPDPVTVPAGTNLEEFVDDYVMRNRHSTFPVVDANGDVRGLITLRRVKQVPRERWRETHVTDVACRVDDVPQSDPEELLTNAFDRLRDDCAEGRGLVMRDGHLVGILAPADINRALELADAARRGSATRS